MQSDVNGRSRVSQLEHKPWEKERRIGGDLERDNTDRLIEARSCLKTRSRASLPAFSPHAALLFRRRTPGTPAKKRLAWNENSARSVPFRVFRHALDRGLAEAAKRVASQTERRAGIASAPGVCRSSSTTRAMQQPAPDCQLTVRGRSMRDNPGQRKVAHSGWCFSIRATTTVISSIISPS